MQKACRNRQSCVEVEKMRSGVPMIRVISPVQNEGEIEKRTIERSIDTVVSQIRGSRHLHMIVLNCIYCRPVCQSRKNHLITDPNLLPVHVHQGMDEWWLPRASIDHRDRHSNLWFKIKLVAFSLEVKHRQR